ncbi:hypothetical protein D9M68_812580 [compost metagenome]
MGQIVGLMHHPEGGQQDGRKDHDKTDNRDHGVDRIMQPGRAADHENDDNRPRDEQLDDGGVGDVFADGGHGSYLAGAVPCCR